jgi:hypothetical protein
MPHANGVAPSGPKKGPAQVATADYRDNWGRVFGAKRERETLN